VKAVYGPGNISGIPPNRKTSRKIHETPTNRKEQENPTMKITSKYWDSRYDALAVYNGESARGIVHTRKYRKKMAAVQKEFDSGVKDVPQKPKTLDNEDM